MPNAVQSQSTSGGYIVTDAKETFPLSFAQSGTSMSFFTTHPECVTITGWPLTEAETINQLGQFFWLFDPVNGQLSYGGWNLVGTTLTFLHVDGYQNFTVNLASGVAHAISKNATRQFDRCSVLCLSGSPTVNGVELTAVNQSITVKRSGNANFPVVIDCQIGGSSSAQVTNMLYN